MNKDKLLLLYDRPQESIALGKGQDKKTQFIVPENYLVSVALLIFFELVKTKSQLFHSLENSLQPFS